MGKIKVRKDVAEEVTSKLQANKNIFHRGQFDAYKIKNMGVAPDGCVYDLDNPTEKFYYDLKMKFAEIDKTDDFEKSSKYIKRWFSNGEWHYKYPPKYKENQNRTETKKDIAQSTKLITGIKPLEAKTEKDIDDAIVQLALYANENELKCTALGNHRIYVTERTQEHIKETHNKPRTDAEMKHKAKYIPFVPEILKHGKICEKSSSKEGVIYGIIGQVEYFDKKKNKNVIESVELAINYDKDSRKFVFSFADKSIKKSLFNNRDINDTFSVCPIVDTKTVPITIYSLSETPILSSKKVSKSLKPDYNGEDRKGKTFDINITDITENNKQQKLEQVNKALNAIADNRPFMIKHIPADSSTNYGNLLVRITDFDRNKIEKAVHKIALSLDADISGASKGESFVYKAQEELTDKYFKELTNRTRGIYYFVIDYFDLPDIRIVSKAGELRHKGKILYNPESGLPIKEADWKKFVVELEKYLNRNYTGIGKKIVLSAESLGIILDRLSKTNSFEAMKKMSLAQIKAKRYDVDWISESVKNMEDKFGDVISRERQARIQVAIDSAAQRVTRVSDDLRNNIQQIIIDGVRDKQSKSVVAQNLFDKCASLNRDMQRIADTEIQMAATNSYIKEEVYNTPKNEKVYFKRFEMMDANTCKKCRKINGTVVLWSDVPLPDEHIKDEYAKIAIWEGKTGGDYPESVMHPYCYSDDTEVMTNNGWKLFKDVEKNDKIMSINPETKEIDFIPFVKQVQYEYNGKMIHFPGRNFDLLVTPDHNMLYMTQDGFLHEKKAIDLIQKDNFALPRAIGKWEKTDTKTVKFGDLTISKAQYFRLWAWYLAEGSGRCRRGGCEVKLAQKDPMKIYNDLSELQSVLHVYDDSVCLMGEYARYFECMFGIYADKKFIPPFIKNSSVENIREFLDAFVLADGSKLENKKCSSEKSYSEFRNEQVLRTSSKKMADDLCEMIVKAGWMPSEKVINEKGRKVHFRNGDYVLNTDCYNISICHSKTRTYAPDTPGHLPRHNPVEVDYKGIVYDVELEKWHFLLVRRNGKCAWSGNCRGTWIREYPDV